MQELLINRIVALYRKHPRPSLFLFLFNAFPVGWAQVVGFDVV